MATLGEKNKNMHQNGFHALSSCTSASHIHAYLNSIVITAIGKKKSILLQHLPPVSVDIIWEEGSSEFPQCIRLHFLQRGHLVLTIFGLFSLSDFSPSYLSDILGQRLKMSPHQIQTRRIQIFLHDSEEGSQTVFQVNNIKYRQICQLVRSLSKLTS